MARRVYADFVTNVGLRLGNRSDVTSTQIGFWINDAVQRIASEFDHKELQKTCLETLTATYDELTPVATDIWWPTTVKNSTSGQIVEPRSREDIDGVLTKSTSSPTQYYWWADKFVFNTMPAANQSLKIWYVAKLPEFTTGSSLLDSRYDVLIEMYAAFIGFQTLRDFEQAQFLEVQANNHVQAAQLPVRRAKLNDYGSGIRVRMR